ncbi:hypothetical protein PLANPX_1053 [Lacipirellula parvula]|uniref:Uncharacterized protein n=1 Tax=Lacipirellula parvula TaxID=2650471 RepID=A0A5K7X9K6_9BACT|nr:hypothetical protein PLANPX_1053 [Lacipirellula parvula]
MIIAMRAILCDRSATYGMMPTLVADSEGALGSENGRR